MKLTEKKELIKKLYAEGKIKKLGNGCYSVPSEFFVHGITPRLVNAVLGNKNKANKIPIIFRKFPEGQIIALFPTIPADVDGFTCQSYMHLGQHGAAVPGGVLRDTKPATPKEYKELMTELHKIGYRNLKVYKRLQYKHLEEARITTREYK